MTGAGDHRFPAPVIARISDAARRPMREPLVLSALELCPDLAAPEAAIVFTVSVEVPIPVWTDDAGEMRRRCVEAIGAAQPAMFEQVASTARAVGGFAAQRALDSMEGPIPSWRGDDR